MILHLKPFEDKLLRELLLEKEINVQAPCGGNGKCGKCKVKLLEGVTLPSPDEEGFVLACKTKLLSECSFYIPTEEDYKVFSADKRADYAICDIGTTNIKICKYSKEGEMVYSCVFRNPQFAYGADVISRISRCKNGGYIKLSEILRKGISKWLEDVNIVYICGNPTMLHFMANEDPSSIGIYPFRPAFVDTKYLKKEETGYKFNMVLLPSVSGYVGSDAVCCIYSAYEENKNILIADLGTNGEISLLKNEEIYSVTTAAGPAIEGAGIEMGLCGGEGVIYHVDSNGNPEFQGEEAKGINGSGLISLISYLLENGKLSAEGKLMDERYYITEKVYISNKDISEFMLAKSAVKTAINLLLEETKTSYEDLDLLILTGGVCGDLDIKSAVNTGLLPKELKEKTVFIPDFAMCGAHTAIAKNDVSHLEEISKKVKVIPLSDNEKFEEEFIMNTFF